MSIFKTKYVNGIDIIVTVCSCGGNLEIKQIYKYI